MSHVKDPHDPEAISSGQVTPPEYEQKRKSLIESSLDSINGRLQELPGYESMVGGVSSTVGSIGGSLKSAIGGINASGMVESTKLAATDLTGLLVSGTTSVTRSITDLVSQNKTPPLDIPVVPAGESVSSGLTEKATVAASELTKGIKAVGGWLTGALGMAQSTQVPPEDPPAAV
jgi:hypothetical protein